MHLSADSPTVGVVGGGQLGRMLAEAASPLGVQLVVSDPTPNCPANHVAREQLVGEFDDYDTLRSLAEQVDVLTYEIELADPDTLDAVSEETGTPSISSTPCLSASTTQPTGVPPCSRTAVIVSRIVVPEVTMSSMM